VKRPPRKPVPESHPSATAPPSGFPQLLLARQRHLRAGRTLTGAGDLVAAMDAVGFANAISGELLRRSRR
jgi:hypothetical protein